MKAEIEEAKKEVTRAYHRAYRKPYYQKNLEKQREYSRLKAREYRARKKAAMDATKGAFVPVSESAMPKTESQKADLPMAANL